MPKALKFRRHSVFFFVGVFGGGKDLSNHQDVEAPSGCCDLAGAGVKRGKD